MAICLHALATLVLADLGLTTLFQVTHNSWWLLSSAGLRNRNSVKVFWLENDLIKRVFDNALGSQFFQIRDDRAGDAFANDGFNSDPTFFGKPGDSRAAQRGEFFEHGLQISCWEVGFEADFVAGFEGSFDHHDHALHFSALPVVGKGVLAGVEVREGGKEFVHDAQLVGAEGRTGLSDIDDGVDKVGDFDFGRSPGKFDVRGDAFFSEVAVGDFESFGGDVFSFEIFDRLDGGIFGNNEDPAGWAGRGAGIGKLGEIDEIDIVSIGPIESGDPAINKTLIDVARDFLSPDHVDIQAVIVRRRTKSAVRGVNIVASLFKKPKGWILQATFRQGDFK